MNDYARVRSKNEKKKTRENCLSLLSHWKQASFLFGPSFRKRRKKKERRIGRHSILSDRFKQHEAGIKEGDARIEGASTRAETKKKRQRRGREKECPV
tara:strand:+ start:7959 stop:8252 length:294 start_codon:yes stop_codon:yes gene_type:complete